MGFLRGGPSAHLMQAKSHAFPQEGKGVSPPTLAPGRPFGNVLPLSRGLRALVARRPVRLLIPPPGGLWWAGRDIAAWGTRGFWAGETWPQGHPDTTVAYHWVALCGRLTTGFFGLWLCQASTWPHGKRGRIPLYAQRLASFWLHAVTMPCLSSSVWWMAGKPLASVLRAVAPSPPG